MLINDYFKDSLEIYIIEDFHHTDHEHIFFTKKNFEFLKFYNLFGYKAPVDNFLKKLRYKKLYNNNDFLNFTKMLTRNGLLSKFRSYFIDLIKHFYWKKIGSGIFNFFNLNNIYYSYWSFSFNEVLRIFFLFKLTFHRLDKNVRKYNRKRKIKITFKYNYVPFFKRSKWHIKLISKFIKFGNNKTFYSNFINLIDDVVKENNKSIFYKLNEFTFRKIKNFSYQKTLINSI